MPAMPESDDTVWLLCSACRRDIFFESVHWVCSVSTCNRSRTRLVFCSVPCWDSHVATLRHRDSWAVESRAPTHAEHARHEAEAARASSAPASPPPAPRSPAAAQPLRAAPEPAQRRSMASPAPPGHTVSGSVTAHAGGPALSNHFTRDDVLIVISKVKKYIRDRSGMNTSDGIAQALGDHVRQICDEAIRAATRDGRKTVLDRDVPRIRA
jgi:hypothetical protein